ncbi:MAG: hypothetical protein VYE68_03260 [Acidobacteriota bacterium]|nr:hypothetical protein [Acidobacteriota bacterium]
MCEAGRYLVRIRVQLSVLVAVTLTGAAPTAHAQSFATGQTISPAYEGWVQNDDGSYDLVFGYMNRNWEQMVDVPVGPENMIEPGGPDQGQPTHFLPRRNRFVFRVPVPADFGDNEVVWTLTTQGQTQRAYGTLKRDYYIDDLVIQANFGAAGAAGSTPELARNEAPVLVVDGDPGRIARVGASLGLAAMVTDDGVPRARPLSPTDPRRPGRITTDTATGLRLSWFVYRGAGGVTFDPQQIATWEDTRVGRHSPWSPGWSTPEAPEDGRWDTRVTFSQPGDYVLRALAHDGGLQDYQDVTVTVTP